MASDPLLRHSGTCGRNQSCAELLDPHDRALQFLALGRLDCCLLPVDLIVDRAAHHKIRRIHRLVWRSTARVILTFRVERQVKCLVCLVFLLLSGVFAGWQSFSVVVPETFFAANDGAPSPQSRP